eukprot:1390400-Rhodomonas_salina.1
MCGTEIAYGTTRCAVLRERLGLRQERSGGAGAGASTAGSTDTLSSYVFPMRCPVRRQRMFISYAVSGTEDNVGRPRVLRFAMRCL